MNIQVIFELSSEQPSNAIVKYKKTCGLLQARGIATDDIDGKLKFEKIGNTGLILSGVGVIDFSKENAIKYLINSQEKFYFSIDNFVSEEDFKHIRASDWMKYIWNKGSVILMLLGYSGEPTCEVVALGYETTLFSLGIL